MPPMSVNTFGWVFYRARLTLFGLLLLEQGADGKQDERPRSVGSEQVHLDEGAKDKQDGNTQGQDVFGLHAVTQHNQRALSGPFHN
jgi:hypothetical protein